MTPDERGCGGVRRVAIVLSNPATSSVTGEAVGFWWSELAHPWLAFRDAGYHVELFSPDGGSCEADALSDPRDPSGYSADDIVSLGFLSAPRLALLPQATRPVSDIRLEDFDALMVVGGQAPMFTFRHAETLLERFREFFEAGKLVAALCHGTAILRYATSSDGTPIVAGRTVTGFANVEEDTADEAVWDMGTLPRGSRLMPWRIEDELRALGANYVRAGAWRPFAIRDGNLVTGQQNHSGGVTAAKIIEALGA